MKGATAGNRPWGVCMDVSIRAPREGGDGSGPFTVVVAAVSIRAPREGGDLTSNASGLTLPRFQSAPPVKGATLRLVSLRDVQRVSIRAPREGGDGDL